MSSLYILEIFLPTCTCIYIVQAALVAINTALDDGDADSTLEALQNEHLDLSDVSADNKEYYFQGLRAKKQEKAVVCAYMYIYMYVLHVYMFPVGVYTLWKYIHVCIAFTYLYMYV